jgi:prepilin-type processing-associated H-X9-DG protein
VVYADWSEENTRITDAYILNTNLDRRLKTFTHGGNMNTTYADGHVGSLNYENWWPVVPRRTGPSDSPSDIPLPWDPWGPGKFGNPATLE